jgi:ammonia channel protein AmtB
MAMSYAYKRNLDVGMMGNGAIAALVAITAACAFVAPWAAIVIASSRRHHVHDPHSRGQDRG